jgi:hypothetical protein
MVTQTEQDVAALGSRGGESPILDKVLPSLDFSLKVAL